MRVLALLLLAGCSDPFAPKIVCDTHHITTYITYHRPDGSVIDSAEYTRDLVTTCHVR